MQSLDESTCPGHINPYLQALWYDAKGNWVEAHKLIQQIDDVNAARIHAYLHRKEGDLHNARYWHRKAGSTLVETLSLEEEWLALLSEMLTADN